MDKCTWIGSGERCDRAAVPGRSYCDEHLHRVYQAGSALRRRPKDIRTATAVRDLEQLFQEAVEELENEGYDFALERWA